MVSNVVVTAQSCLEWPFLEIFIAHLKSHYAVGIDATFCNVPNDLMMSDLWDKFSMAEKNDMCTQLARFGRYKGIHPGVLALMPVATVMSGVMMPHHRIEYGFQLLRPKNIMGVFTTS